MTTTTTPTHGVGNLALKRVIGYGFGDAGCNIAFQMTGLFLLVYYTDVVGLDPRHSSMIFIFIKVWDAFADIFAGRLVDSTMTKWGKFRPFLLWYSVPLLASNLLCFWIPVTDYTMKVIWATVSYALLGLLYSLVNIPFGSLAGAMSQDPQDRSRMSAARMVGSGFTILVLGVLLAPQIKAAANLQRTFLFTAIVFLVVGTVFFAITFITAKERVVREVERVSLRDTLDTVRRNGPLLRLCASSFFYLTGQNVVSAMGIYIGLDLLGQFTDGNWAPTVVTIITTGAVLYMGPFGPAITRYLGKKRGFIIAALFTVAGMIIFWLGTSHLANLWLALVGLFIAGAGMAVLNTMTWALEADTVEYGELQTGIRTEGATYAAFSFTRKVGQGVGMALAGAVLSLAGYVARDGGGHMTQANEVLASMGLWLAIFAGGCFLAACLIMMSYPLTEERFQEVMAAIAEKRAKFGSISGHADSLEAPTSTPTP
ncbi:glycoside-pentoside-hexuronide (GPH):cation symporter [Corynebacterium uberis]|uniref:glycoside-pentoside-hexuronide (GPH):cation symporter n=1 Tax=Corynebacterium TaxID=1716 RepID=UPI001D0BAF2A|nr:MULTISPECIES: glycoside-pentoside-hexuronide (GPH):cation symporter [Corynebacterium]MCZ9310234.1 glycoside-pentoside-hexuronide (GPH):cation symporter [Corynebacterium sp. c6VSa_13]UDL73708.1 glycoside-pentoside-hexuronide (GPH):cation symporter [Corynebacterium uberis]UDL75410.1 glycoside-pentoside-hexuronide (GPH):cation symporter [Corynebacterium uberis]UDL77623.1 glycoside-pentoside-hexuronide (GPH):cation symporter [Corynebacterium uberis]UDL79908.1 glycoside-pentoside-hexuronide (GPH